MTYRTIKGRFKRYRSRNQVYHPSFFKAMDLMIEGSKLMLVVAVFGSIFYTI